MEQGTTSAGRRQRQGLRVQGFSRAPRLAGARCEPRKQFGRVCNPVGRKEETQNLGSPQPNPICICSRGAGKCGLRGLVWERALADGMAPQEAATLLPVPREMVPVSVSVPYHCGWPCIIYHGFYSIGIISMQRAGLPLPPDKKRRLRSWHARDSDSDGTMTNGRPCLAYPDMHRRKKCSEMIGGIIEEPWKRGNRSQHTPFWP